MFRFPQRDVDNEGRFVIYTHFLKRDWPILRRQVSRTDDKIWHRHDVLNRTSYSRVSYHVEMAIFSPQRSHVCARPVKAQSTRAGAVLTFLIPSIIEFSQCAGASGFVLTATSRLKAESDKSLVQRDTTSSGELVRRTTIFIGESGSRFLSYLLQATLPAAS
jgi:hypothetical protein